jgi:hypothetical protein
MLFFKDEPSILNNFQLENLYKGALDGYDFSAELGDVAKRPSNEYDTLFSILVKTGDKGIEVCEIILKHFMQDMQAPSIPSKHLFFVNVDKTSNVYRLASFPKGIEFLQNYFPISENFDNASFINALCPDGIMPGKNDSPLFLLSKSDVGRKFILYLLEIRPALIRSIPIANWLAPGKIGENDCAGTFILAPESAENADILKKLPVLTVQILKKKLNDSSNKQQLKFFPAPVNDGALITTATGLTP